MLSFIFHINKKNLRKYKLRFISFSFIIIKKDNLYRMFQKYTY